MEKPRQISKSKTKHKIKNILEWEDLCDDDSYDENEQFSKLIHINFFYIFI